MTPSHSRARTSAQFYLFRLVSLPTSDIKTYKERDHGTLVQEGGYRKCSCISAWVYASLLRQPLLHSLHTEENREREQADEQSSYKHRILDKKKKAEGEREKKKERKRQRDRDREIDREKIKLHACVNRQKGLVGYP